MAEGWACYADLMDEAGFLTPLESLSQHHAHLRMAARGEVTNNGMFPGAALMYLVGANLIHTLRRRADGDGRVAIRSAGVSRSLFVIRLDPGQLDSRGDVIRSGGVLEIESSEAPVPV